MAGEERKTTNSLALFKALEEEPYAFDFLQALRRIECAFADKPRIGASLRPADDPVRLGQEPSLAFPPATLHSFRIDPHGHPRLNVLFQGLFGPNGPLPLHLTEYARDRIYNHKDRTFARFADLFHHRMLSLFYRAWSTAEPTVNYDRPDQDRFALYLGATMGLGQPSLQHRDELPDIAKLHYAGHLVCQSRHVDGLQAMIADYFRMPVTIEEFVGHWIALDENSQTRLGESPHTGLLGVNAVAGARVWDCQHKFRIIVGPIGYADYRRLLPGGDSLRRLVALVRNYIEDGLNWDLKLILKKEEVPPLQLGKAGELGWTTWSANEPLQEDADDLELDAVAYVTPSETLIEGKETSRV